MDQELKDAVFVIRNAAECIREAAELIEKTLGMELNNSDTACADAQENSVAPVQASVEADGRSSVENKPEMTFEELRGVYAEKARAGFTAEVRNLLGQYGVNKLSELKPEDYVAFRAEVEVFGRG